MPSLNFPFISALVAIGTLEVYNVNMGQLTSHRREVKAHMSLHSLARAFASRTHNGLIMIGSFKVYNVNILLLTE